MFIKKIYLFIMTLQGLDPTVVLIHTYYIIYSVYINRIRAMEYQQWTVKSRVAQALRLHHHYHHFQEYQLQHCNHHTGICYFKELGWLG